MTRHQPHPWPAAQPVLGDGCVVLRAVVDSDVEDIWQACQDPAIAHFTQVPVPYARADAEGFVSLCRQWWSSGATANFAWQDAVTGRFAGVVGIIDADWSDRAAGVGYWTAPWARGRGLTARAVRLATGWALSDGGLVSLRAEAEAVNAGSVRVLEGAGFTRADVPDELMELKGSVRRFASWRLERPEPPDDVLAELVAREPLFHRTEHGTTRAAFEAMTAEDFWEVGASGRVYDREAVWAILEPRYAAAEPEQWETSGFALRRLAPDVHLLTYLLREGERLTRRATIWERVAGTWRLVYHQGTVVTEDGAG